MHTHLKFIVLISLSFLITACANLDFLKLDFLKLNRTPVSIVTETKIAPQWQAPLPHDGSMIKLAEFWQQFDDALLIELITDSQQVSSNVATAKTRIAQARAARVTTIANTRPSLDGTFSASRAVQQPAIDGGSFSGQGQGTQQNGQQVGGFGFGSGAINTSQIGLQSAWELDIFGANRILIDSAKKTEMAAKANWHEARVAVAAELATSYFNQRFCQVQLLINQKDLKSRQETARITAIAIKAGFTPSASQYLADVSVQDAQQQLNAQIAQCDLNIKELVALTDLQEPILREKLVKQAFETDVSSTKNRYKIDAITANVLAQRPDISNAEAELIAAAASVQSNKAARLPRITLNGSIGWMWLSGAGFSGSGEIWSLGPLSITLPIFDSGKRESEINSAQAKYEESAVNYRSKIRNAVKEVESALVNLHSFEARNEDLQQALLGYQASFKATESKVRAGFANLIELEESRRLTLQTDTNLNDLQHNRTNAWVSLYRAAGGDWQKNNMRDENSLENLSVKKDAQ